MTDIENSKDKPAKPRQTTAPVSQGDKDKPAVQSDAKSGAQAQPSQQSGQQPNQQRESAAAGKGGKQAEKAKIKSKTPQETAKKAAKPKRPFPITAALALALGLAIGAASYLNYTRWQAADLHTQSVANENTKLRSELGQLQQQISGLQRQDLDSNLAIERLSTDSKLQNDSMNQLSRQFQALAADKGKDPMLWRLAEVEFLLSVANHQLILQSDVRTALTALQDADRRLEAIGDPALIPVRKLIASETTELQSVDTPDITGMALRLSALVDNIQQLPLVSRERLKTEVAMDDSQMVDDVNELMARIMKDLKGVVSIRRSDQPIEPLLPPEEQHYLSQNLGLKLEEARIALLRRDTATFRQNLADTEEWVQRYFDPKAAAVNNVITTVNELRDVELKPRLPDISGSLRELRHWLSKQKSQQKSQQQSRRQPTQAQQRHTAASPSPATKPSADASGTAEQESSMPTAQPPATVPQEAAPEPAAAENI